MVLVACAITAVGAYLTAVAAGEAGVHNENVIALVVLPGVFLLAFVVLGVKALLDLIVRKWQDGGSCGGGSSHDSRESDSYGGAGLNGEGAWR
jgi:hypothetical protein